MTDSFVVGVTPDGRRHPLFVGTVGEVRSFADRAKANGGVVDGTWYKTIRWSESVSPTYVMEFPAAPTYVPSEAELANMTAVAKPPAAKRPAARKKTPPAPTTPGAPAADPDDTGI